jgi:hypothetical protein
MGRFIEGVRTGSVKGPQQQGFKETDWQKAFAKLKDDSEDEALYKSGSWFSGEFAKVRALVLETEKPLRGFNSRSRKLAILGFASFQWLGLKTAVEKAILSASESGFFLSELNAISFSGVGNQKLDPENLLEVLVDGMRYPLSIFPTTTSPIQKVEPGEAITALVRLIMSGQHYHALEQDWLDCIWNGFRVEIAAEAVVIERPDKLFGQRQAISEFRRVKLASESMHHGRAYWEKMPGREKDKVLADLNVLSVFKKGGRFRVKAAEAMRFKHRSSTAPMARILLPPEHADVFLHRRVSKWSGLRLHDILAAFELLSQIPEQLPNFLPNPKVIEDTSELVRFAVFFLKQEIIEAFASALSITDQQAGWIVEFMTHGAKVREQFWFQPLVEVSETELGLVVPAVAGVNYSRLIDRLLSMAPDLEAELGPVFERFIHAQLASAFADSRIRSVLKISSGPGIRLIVGQKFEEVDLAFLVGDKLFICELKSAPFPTEPLEHLHYRQKIEEAIDQAKRKSDFVAHNRAIVSQLGFQADPKLLRIYPLVVTSSALLAGWIWNGVAVCDWPILRVFFEEGKLDMLASQNANGDLVPTRSFKFYDTALDAVNEVDGYLTNAPSVRVFEPFVRLKSFPLPTFKEDEKPPVLRTFVVELPHEALRKMMEKV